jgi:hypothetical protein
MFRHRARESVPRGDRFRGHLSREMQLVVVALCCLRSRSRDGAQKILLRLA